MKYLENPEYKKYYVDMVKATELLDIAMLPVYIRMGFDLNDLRCKIERTFHLSSLTAGITINSSDHLAVWEAEYDRCVSGVVTQQQYDALIAILGFFESGLNSLISCNYLKQAETPTEITLVDDPSQPLISPVLTQSVIDNLKSACIVGTQNSEHRKTFQSVIDYLHLDDKEIKNDINE